MIRCGRGGTIFMTEGVMLARPVKSALVTDYARVPGATLLFANVATGRRYARERGEPGFWRVKNRQEDRDGL